jgi:hypothetical protein
MTGIAGALARIEREARKGFSKSSYEMNIRAEHAFAGEGARTPS